MTPLKFVAIALLLFVGLTTCAAPLDESTIDQRIRDWEPKAKEKRFDEIGWAADIRTAERLAREHHRPIFLFTHDGRMNIGRC